jgi:glutamate 5-kinase
MSKFQNIVVKLGTSTLTASGKDLAAERIVDLARQVSTLMRAGVQVTLVSSGAGMAGRAALGHISIPKTLPAKQMLVAIGQPRLMALYEQLFGIYKVTVAQILLTRHDLARRASFLNARNTFHALLAQGILPIVNENDTVATDEIRVGDNDNLSALVANLITADLLLLLTDQAGVYTSDPRKNPQATRWQVIDTPEIPESMWQAAGGSGEGGTGGMLTKLEAARLARNSGATVLVAAGNEPDAILRAANGTLNGTTFLPVRSALESRKRYIVSGWDKHSRLVVDAGAVRALQKGSSLLPVGVRSCVGEFERGDTVAVCTLDGKEIARGLVNYSHNETRKILGEQSNHIANVLGYDYGDELIHRDHLVLME